jgi:L-ascorbate metabolism protein UlaG (beta-lactamase superfamily)
MQITKIGHCCLIIEDQGKTILTDPGMFSSRQNEIKGINLILITHEHADHFHVDSLKVVLKNNPEAIVITNSSVGKLLDEQGVVYQLLEHGQNKKIADVLLEGFGQDHAPIYPTVPRVENTGYFISNRFFYPGDAFTDPGKAVEILALPVVGPWMHISEAIDYALKLAPKFAFPVHDGFLKFGGPFYSVPKMIMEPKGIKFIEPEGEKPMEF